MEHIAGLDVSLRSCALCIVDAKGKIYLERDLPCEVGAISDCLRSFPTPISRLGFEARTVSQHLFFGLQEEGFDFVCMEARRVNAALYDGVPPGGVGAPTFGEVRAGIRRPWRTV